MNKPWIKRSQPSTSLVTKNPSAIEIPWTSEAACILMGGGAALLCHSFGLHPVAAFLLYVGGVVSYGVAGLKIGGGAAQLQKTPALSAATLLNKLPDEHKEPISSAMADEMGKVTDLIQFLKTLQQEWTLTFDENLGHAFPNDPTFQDFKKRLFSREASIAKIAPPPTQAITAQKTQVPVVKKYPCDKPHPALLKIKTGHRTCVGLKVASHYYVFTTNKPCAEQITVGKIIEVSSLDHGPTQVKIKSIKKLDSTDFLIRFGIDTYNQAYYAETVEVLPGAEAHFGYTGRGLTRNAITDSSNSKMCMQSFSSYNSNLLHQSIPQGTPLDTFLCAVLFSPKDGEILGLTPNYIANEGVTLIPKNKVLLEDFQHEMERNFGFQLKVNTQQ